MNRFSVELQRKIALSLHELKSLRAQGPRFRIIHRTKEIGSIDCIAGEEVSSVHLLHRSNAYFVRLPLSQRQLLDNLAKNRLPRSAAQICSSMSTDKFYSEHGRSISPGKSMVRRFSHSSIKEYIRRLRLSLAQVFDEANLGVDPALVVASVKTTSNEVLYALHATVEWQHITV